MDLLHYANKIQEKKDIEKDDKTNARKEKRKIAQVNYYIKHEKEIKERQKKYREMNKSEISEKNKCYYRQQKSLTRQNSADLKLDLVKLIKEGVTFVQIKNDLIKKNTPIEKILDVRDRYRKAYSKNYQEENEEKMKEYRKTYYKKTVCNKKIL